MNTQWVINYKSDIWSIDFNKIKICLDLVLSIVLKSFTVQKKAPLASFFGRIKKIRSLIEDRHVIFGKLSGIVTTLFRQGQIDNWQLTINN